MAFGDRIMAQARASSIRLEALAAMDLQRNLGDYMPPHYGARRMVDAYANYAWSGGKNNDPDYRLMRSTFHETKGRSHHVFNSVLGQYIPAERYALANSMFGKGDWGDTIKGAVRSLQRDGLWIARFKLPDAIWQGMRDKSMKRLVDAHGDMIEKMVSGAPDASPQVKSNYGWVMTIEEMMDVASDPLLLTIVHDYLGVPPIFDTPVVFMNSNAPLDERGLSNTAQLYHHDMHRLAFVKLFMYLTDVGPEDGPHAMIPGTHVSRPDGMWIDGRSTDETVASHGLLDKEVHITGPAGTLFMVDTRALHKGVHPVANHRLLAQVQYTNSKFGKPEPDSQRILHASKGSSDADTLAAAAIVKKACERVGVRFCQALI